MIEEGLSIDEVDAITGPAMGRPKSATFRLGDIVGVDLMAQMGRNLRELLKHDPQIAVFRQVDFIEDMVKRGWWGEKKGQGFYQRVKTDKGREILTLDYKTMEYRPQQKPQFASLEAVEQDFQPRRSASARSAPRRTRPASSPGNISARCSATPPTGSPEIADDVVTVDNAMKWGYNWELGPFEIWDALGVPRNGGSAGEGRPRSAGRCPRSARRRQNFVLRRTRRPTLLLRPRQARLRRRSRSRRRPSIFRGCTKPTRSCAAIRARA